MVDVVDSTFLHKDELADSLCCLSSLEALGLICHFPLTALGGVPLYPITKAAIISYTSYIAQRIPTIEVFFIDVGHGDQSFDGQLEVRNLGVEGRHTVIIPTVIF